MRFGTTSNNSTVVITTEGRKYALYRQCGEWDLRGSANFPAEITTERTPETPQEWLAWQKVHEAEQQVVNAHKQYIENASFAGESRRLRLRSKQTVKVLDEAVRKRVKTAPMGTLRKSVTERQWQLLLCGKRPVDFDQVFYATLKTRLHNLRLAAQKRRPGRGWHAPVPPTRAEYQSRLRQQLYNAREQRKQKRVAAIAKRAIPLNRFLTHATRRFDQSVYAMHNLGQFRIGPAIAGSSTNQRGRWRSTPGTAGVQLIRGYVVLTTVQRGGKCFAFKLPKNWRKATPGVAHPLGLFCVPSTACPGFHENWGMELPNDVKKMPVVQRPLKGLPEHVRLLKQEWKMLGYSYKGVAVPDKVARRTYTVEEVFGGNNQEVRRVMIELLPPEILETSGILRVLHRDDFGTLFVAGLPRDAEDLKLPWPDTVSYTRPVMGAHCFTVQKRGLVCFVKVVNSTAEPDGTFKDYYLQVPPSVQTAKEAVAWTFGLSEDQYQPKAES